MDKNNWRVKENVDKQLEAVEVDTLRSRTQKLQIQNKIIIKVRKAITERV